MNTLSNIGHSYLETGGHGADSDIRPWVWVVMMFLGPAIRSLAFQWYIFINTRTLVRGEAIITQLVFEHSLRIRLKAEGGNEKSERTTERDASTVVGTPETASIAESSAAGSAADEEESVTTGTAVSREPSTSSQSSVALGKAKETKPKKEDSKEKEKEKEKKNSNLIGKINNLVTTDLNNILESRDFLLLGEIIHRLWAGNSYELIFLSSSICPVADVSLYYLPIPNSRVEVRGSRNQSFILDMNSS